MYYIWTDLLDCLHIIIRYVHDKHWAWFIHETVCFYMSFQRYNESLWKHWRDWYLVFIPCCVVNSAFVDVKALRNIRKSNSFVDFFYIINLIVWIKTETISVCLKKELIYEYLEICTKNNRLKTVAVSRNSVYWH